MNKFLLIAAVAACGILASCGVNPQSAKRALESQGVTQVEIGGYPLWGCAKGEGFASKFTGIGANGDPVSGVLCSGLLKGITVRYD